MDGSSSSWELLLLSKSSFPYTSLDSQELPWFSLPLPWLSTSYCNAVTFEISACHMTYPSFYGATFCHSHPVAYHYNLHFIVLRQLTGLGNSSLVESLPSMYKALSLMRTIKLKQNKKIRLRVTLWRSRCCLLNTAYVCKIIGCRCSSSSLILIILGFRRLQIHQTSPAPKVLAEPIFVNNVLHIISSLLLVI